MRYVLDRSSAAMIAPTDARAAISSASNVTPKVALQFENELDVGQRVPSRHQQRRGLRTDARRVLVAQVQDRLHARANAGSRRADEFLRRVALSCYVRTLAETLLRVELDTGEHVDHRLARAGPVVDVRRRVAPVRDLAADGGEISPPS